MLAISKKPEYWWTDIEVIGRFGVIGFRCPTCGAINLELKHGTQKECARCGTVYIRYGNGVHVARPV